MYVGPEMSIKWSMIGKVGQFWLKPVTSATRLYLVRIRVPCKFVRGSVAVRGD